MTLMRLLRPRARLLHPAAWWLWGLGLATAASRTTNPAVLLLVIAVCVLVVTERRDPATPNPLPGFLAIAAVVLASS
jgi:energy-coupling factor transport system permease protein